MVLLVTAVSLIHNSFSVFSSYKAERFLSFLLLDISRFSRFFSSFKEVMSSIKFEDITSVFRLKSCLRESIFFIRLSDKYSSLTDTNSDNLLMSEILLLFAEIIVTELISKLILSVLLIQSSDNKVIFLSSISISLTEDLLMLSFLIFELSTLSLQSIFVVLVFLSLQSIYVESVFLLLLSISAESVFLLLVLFSSIIATGSFVS